MKRILSAVLAVIMLAILFSACDTEQVPQTPKELPASVDLRNFNGKNYVTPVKRQLFGDCWAFGVAAAAETSYLYANDLGVPAGEVNDSVDFSEKYITWYVYHSITDEDVTMGKVRASQVGEGYDTEAAEKEFADTVYFFGGAIYAGANMFASGFLPVDESVSVDGEKPYFYSGKYSKQLEGEVQYSQDDDWSLPLNAKYRNPDTKGFVRNGYLLPSPALVDENGVYTYNEDGVTAIRTELANGHAVALAALVDGMMNYDNWATYNRSGTANHVITVVGYDDNYPKENFAQKTSDGAIDEESIPPTDGAFIIKNSQGEWGLDSSGYFYLSYHDHSISSPISFRFDSSDSVTYQSLNYDQYDMLMIGWSGYSDYDSETKMANVFDAEEDESLYQIEYKTKMPDTSVHYEIYKNIEDGSPDSGTLLEKGDNTHEWGGYHKIDLNRKHKLKKGEKYSVVLTMTYTDDDGNTRYTDVAPYATNLMHEVVANGVINKGESYLFTLGKWCDLYDLKDTIAESLYKQNASENLPDAFKAKSVADIAVDNYPIKAILIPKSEL